MAHLDIFNLSLILPKLSKTYLVLVSFVRADISLVVPTDHGARHATKNLKAGQIIFVSSNDIDCLVISLDRHTFELVHREGHLGIRR